MGQDRTRGLAGDHRADHVADGQGFGALLFGLALRRERIGGLPRLADQDGQRIRVHDRVAVAELASVIHLDGNLRQPLEQELAGQRGVPTGATGHDLYGAEVLKLLFGDVHLVEEDFAGLQRDAAQ